MTNGDNPVSIWAIGCGDRIVWALAIGVNTPQERLNIIRQVDDGPGVSLFTHSPLLPLGLGRLQPERQRTGFRGSYGGAGRTAPHFASDQANHDDHQQWQQGNQSSARSDPGASCSSKEHPWTPSRRTVSVWAHPIDSRCPRETPRWILPPIDSRSYGRNGIC